jgi:hypothetical protein
MRDFLPATMHVVPSLQWDVEWQRGKVSDEEFSLTAVSYVKLKVAAISPFNDDDRHPQSWPDCWGLSISLSFSLDYGGLACCGRRYQNLVIQEPRCPVLNAQERGMPGQPRFSWQPRILRRWLRLRRT